MDFRKYIIIPVCLFVFFSCNSKSENKETIKKSQSLSADTMKSYLTDTTSINSDVFKFMVTSNYLYNSNQERPLFFNQVVSILKNGKVMYSEKHDVDYDSVRTGNGYLKYLLNFVTKIGVIKSEGRNYFIVDGWGGCNDCSTYSAIFDENGELVYKLFWNEKTDTTYSRIGDLSRVFHNNNDLKKYKKRDYDIIKEPCAYCLQSKNINSFEDPYGK